MVTATLTDIDGSVKTTQIEITTTFGIISSPEGNSISLSVGNSVEYNYSSDVSPSTMINIIVKSGSNYISYILSSDKLTISALSAGNSKVEVQLLNKATND
jgi:hypothetical protein